MEELFLGQRYRATEQIGTGGMADVYKAVDEVLGRTVAVKVMHAHLAEDPSFAARFRHEAQGEAVPDADTTTGTDLPAEPVLEMLEVPDIIDMPEDEAVETLERAGFTPEALPPQFNNDVRKDKVFEQTPASPDTAPEGSVITYMVSLGDAPGKNDRDDKGD